MSWPVRLGLSLVVFESASARQFPVTLEFPTGAESPTFPLVCEWLQRMAQQLDPGATSVELARSAVLHALRSVNMTTWTWLQADTLIAPVVENITETLCQFYPGMSSLQYHAWKHADEATLAAPHNHKIMFENRELRVIDVYAPGGTREQFHNHRSFSLFFYYGISMGMTDYGPDGEVRADSSDWNGEDPPRLRVIWANPEWFHAVYNKASGNNPLAPNCPLERAPADCNGFLFRVEFILGDSYVFQGDETIVKDMPVTPKPLLSLLNANSSMIV